MRQRRHYMKPVCKDCTERHAACHDTCKKYLAAKQELFEAKLKETKDSDIDRYIEKGQYERAHYRFEMRRRGRKIY